VEGFSTYHNEEEGSMGNAKPHLDMGFSSKLCLGEKQHLNFILVSYCFENGNA